MRDDGNGSAGRDEICTDAVDVASDDAQTAIAAYFGELDRRFDGGFDPLGGGADHDAELMAPPTGRFLVMRRGEAVIGCGGLQRVDDETVEIKRMWIDGGHRGQRLGSRLLGVLEDAAASLGYARIVLDTNGALTEAIAMYRRAGYGAIERYNDNPYAQYWFEKRLPHSPTEPPLPLRQAT